MAKKMTMKGAMKKYESSSQDAKKDKAGAKALMKKANNGKKKKR